MGLTWEIAEEGLFSCVAAHVRLQGIAAGVVGALPAAANPLAGVFLLPTFDVFVMNVLDQPVHRPQVSGVAVLPHAYRHLRLEVLVLKPRVCW